MPQQRTYQFNGIGVAPGIAIGPAYVIEPKAEPQEGYTIEDSEVEEETARLHKAIGLARDEITRIGEMVSTRIDPQQAAIFDAHRYMLDDPIIVGTTEQRIRAERLNAEYVFWTVVQGVAAQIRDIGDQYLAERSNDLFDIGRRVLKFLTILNSGDAAPPKEGAIVVAPELGPADAAEYHHAGIAAICLNQGGPTGHTAILARSFGMPAAFGLEDITYYVRTGNLLIVDGNAGKVILNPSPEQVSHYRTLQKGYLERRLRLESLRELPAETRDGCRIHLFANIEFPEEVEAALHNGAEGIGLYRTEFLYLEKTHLPSEDDQYRAYRHVLDRVDGPVTFRTLDLGGDKLPEAMPFNREENPFLGLRALRFCLAQPKVFRAQLRALIRAAEGRVLRIMLPMVCCLEEVEKALAFIQRVESELVAYGHAPVAEMHIGIMVEVPSAALMADVFAERVDFFSIGTNDLTQYTLAVDRMSQSVAHLYQPTHPAVLALVRQVIEAGRRGDVPVSVCGEIAGDPTLALLLVGMGVRELSLSPSSLPEVKRAIRASNLSDLEAAARSALAAPSAAVVLEQLQRGALARIVAQSE
ncbi:MAG: phosphoenolpyruvate--protein phosphotransferase [Candidatus Sumerlaeia bacterium]|nr:phosphoenolpyruvate--protein phosphotransferase [Candidatus Sumerlaeia bacterium]